MCGQIDEEDSYHIHSSASSPLCPFASLPRCPLPLYIACLSDAGIFSTALCADGLPYNASSREPHMLAYFIVGARAKELWTRLGAGCRSTGVTSGMPAESPQGMRMQSEQVAGKERHRRESYDCTRQTDEPQTWPSRMKHCDKAVRHQ